MRNNKPLRQIDMKHNKGFLAQILMMDAGDYVDMVNIITEILGLPSHYIIHYNGDWFLDRFSCKDLALLIEHGDYSYYDPYVRYTTDKKGLVSSVDPWSLAVLKEDEVAEFLSKHPDIAAMFGLTI